MAMAGWGGVADTGFSGVPPEIRDTVERWMEEGPPAVAVEDASVFLGELLGPHRRRHGRLDLARGGPEIGEEHVAPV